MVTACKVTAVLGHIPQSIIAAMCYIALDIIVQSIGHSPVTSLLQDTIHPIPIPSSSLIKQSSVRIKFPESQAHLGKFAPWEIILLYSTEEMFNITWAAS